MFLHAIHRRVQATPKEERAKIFIGKYKNDICGRKWFNSYPFCFYRVSVFISGYSHFFDFNFVLLSEEPIRSIKEVRLYKYIV